MGSGQNFGNADISRRAAENAETKVAQDLNHEPHELHEQGEKVGRRSELQVEQTAHCTLPTVHCPKGWGRVRFSKTAVNDGLSDKSNRSDSNSESQVRNPESKQF